MKSWNRYIVRKMSAFTYSEMLIQFQKICAYYFFDENFESKIMKPILRKIPDEKNVNDYVKQNEEATDDFIHKIASFVDGDRNESIKLINNAPEEILTTLIIRLLTFDDYCHKNPDKSYPVLKDSNQQLVIECLINFCRSYDKIKLVADEQELLDNFKKLSERSKGRLLEKAENLIEIETPLVIEPEFTYIDLYELPVSAGTGIDLSGYDKEEIKIRSSAEADQADFCLKISGDSMEPDFHDGDVVLVKGKPKIEIGQIGIFVVNGSGYIKELGKNRLISLNDDYDDIRLTENDSVWCMGEVIATLEEDDFLE